MTSFKPTIESLEDRALMSITSSIAANGVMTLTSDGASDTIRVRQNGNQFSVNGAGFQNLTGFFIHGNGGNDTIDLEGVTKPATITGGSGNDFITGTAANDLINGGGNNDTIFGRGGNDVLHGDADNDRIYGGSGYDYIYGESGTDFLDDGNRAAEEYFDSGTGADFLADRFAINGTSVTDINQRQSPTCAFLASLAAGCDGGINYANWIEYGGYDSTGMPFYMVKLWHPTSGYFTQAIKFDGTTYSNDTATARNDPSRVDESESWPLLMQRAYNNYASNHSNYTNPTFALATATGATPIHYTNNDPNLKTAIVTALNANRPVITAVDHATFYGITNHALAVIGQRGTFANLELLIYNPWGRDTQNSLGQDVAINGGSATDGLFWVTYSQFKSYFDAGIYVR